MRDAILNRLVKIDLIVRVASQQRFEGSKVVLTLMFSHSTCDMIIYPHLRLHIRASTYVFKPTFCHSLPYTSCFSDINLL